MTPIRPNAFPIQTPVSGGAGPAGDGRSAAQRAFFDAALGRAGSPAATPAPKAASPVAAAAPRFDLRPSASPNPAASTSPGEAPNRILRPGSLLDIRV